MEEMEASSVAKTVASCEPNRLNPPQAAGATATFRRPACSAHANLAREAERAAIARALGLDVPAPLPNPADRELLRDDIP